MMHILQFFTSFGVGCGVTATFFYLLLERERSWVRKKLAKAEEVLLMLNVDDYLAVDEDGVVHSIERDDMDFVFRCNLRRVPGHVYHYTAGRTPAERRPSCIVCMGSS